MTKPPIFFTTALLILLSAAVCFSQTAGKSKPPSAAGSSQSATKSSPAYAELLLRQTERTAELEELRLDYTEEFPKVKELKFESDLLQKEMNKILAVNPSETGKLTLALGKLIVRKVEIEVDLWNLRIQLKDDQAEVKRAIRKVEVYDKAIREILQ